MVDKRGQWVMETSGSGLGSSYMRYIVNTHATGHLKCVLFTVEDTEA